ncbi:MAG: hypothetical protein QGG40_13945, partial [Myxococcota bacterium]|nr:hypothetical protein [Myxococcota bacterium]
MIRKPLAVFLELVLAVGVYLVVAAAMTWPAVRHMDEVVIGSGELGGWLWRQWWHFQEVGALGSSESLGMLDRLQALVGLGRFPETGNILDLLILDYPLEQALGFPWHHNLKVLVILVGNGVCGYALARTQTTSTVVALTAGTVAVINPLVIQDVNKTGLRQVLLWWLLLYPVVLERAGRTGKMRDGALAGAMFAMTSAFYWFYGVFAAMYSVIWLIGWWLRRRLQPWATLRWMSAATVTAAVGLG